MSLIVGDSAKASRPGEINIDPGKFLDYFDVGGVKKIYYLSLFKILSNEVLIRRFENDTVIHNYIEKVEHFQLGCVNPSVVVNKSKGIIATYTNLANNSGAFVPVIKVTQERLDLVRNMPVFDGKKIATVSLYMGYEDQEQDAWFDFEPYLPNCFTDDLSAYRHCFDRMEKKDWDNLDEAIGLLENPEDPGLYYISEEKS